jgi:hypothetical protein
MSAYAAGYIKFYFKTDRALVGTERIFLEVKNCTPGNVRTVILDSSYWDSSNPSWQEISVPLAPFDAYFLGGLAAGINLPFMISVDGGGQALGNPSITAPISMDVDYVRWTQY